jgi:hypothetical protein
VTFPLSLAVAWAGVMVVLHLVWLLMLRRSTGHNPRGHPPTGRRNDHMANFTPAWEYRGAGLLGWVRVYAPFLRVAASAEWVRIRTPRRSVWIARDACEVIAKGSATRFRAPDGRYDGITVWIGKKDELTVNLATLGWRIWRPHSPA